MSERGVVGGIQFEAECAGGEACEAVFGGFLIKNPDIGDLEVNARDRGGGYHGL